MEQPSGCHPACLTPATHAMTACSVPDPTRPLSACSDITTTSEAGPLRSVSTIVSNVVACFQGIGECECWQALSKSEGYTSGSQCAHAVQHSTPASPHHAVWAAVCDRSEWSVDYTCPQGMAIVGVRYYRLTPLDTPYENEVDDIFGNTWAGGDSGQLDGKTGLEMVRGCGSSVAQGVKGFWAPVGGRVAHSLQM